MSWPLDPNLPKPINPKAYSVTHEGWVPVDDGDLDAD